jgi:membrane protease YdiL (CAAX protease family)
LVVREPRLATGTGLVVSLGLPALAAWSLVPLGIRPSLAVVIAPLWAITLLLLLMVRALEGESYASIGIRTPSRADLGWGVVGYGTGFVSIAVGDPVVQWLGLRSAEAVAAQQLTWAIPLVLLTSPITEEILFRGYAIERLEKLTGRTEPAVVVSVAAFLLAHVPLWGVGGALQFLPWSILISVLYVWRRNLPACIVMHFLGDLTGLVLIPVLAK